MRTLQIEQLETRLACYAPCPTCDVNADGQVTNNDALQTINAVNAGSHDPRFDVNGSGVVSSLDALMIFNWLNLKPATIYRVRIADADTVGFTDQQVRDAIFAAFDEYEAIADVGFDFVTTSPHVTIDTHEIYLGNGQHARGYQIDNLLSLHDGIIAPYHHSGNNGPVSQTLHYQVFNNQSTIQQVFGHEFGHWLGLGHSGDPTCRMNINSPPGFCSAERTYLVNRFGVTKQ